MVITGRYRTSAEKSRIAKGLDVRDSPKEIEYKDEVSPPDGWICIGRCYGEYKDAEERLKWETHNAYGQPYPNLNVSDYKIMWENRRWELWKRAN